MADWRCGRYPEVKPDTPPPYEVKRGYCFELSFDTRSPVSEVPFDMRVGGLIRNEKKVTVPVVHFEKGSFWIMAF